MFFQQTPPDTVLYMVMGFIVIFGVMGIYIASLFTRFRSLQKDLEVLEDLDNRD